MAVVVFSQRDPRWAAEPLGTGTVTIGQALTWRADTEAYQPALCVRAG